MRIEEQHYLLTIQGALAEDLGDGDATTLATIPADQQLTGYLMAKEAGVIAGLEVAQLTFQQLDPAVEFVPLVQDGARVAARTRLANLRGAGRALLSGERVALNFLQRMSGIASQTARFVEAVAGSRAVILDTRKTAPGLRYFDKWAVRLGGGQNHRIGLYDMFLIKDNHIAAAGGITAAVRSVRAMGTGSRLIEVEVTNQDELRECLALGVDRILLDNMDEARLRQAVKVTAGRVPLEASGNVTLQTVGKIAATGVDFISVGSLTHSVAALDINLTLLGED